MLVAGGLVAVAVASPAIEAPTASAAPNFTCTAPGAPTLYATGNSAANPSNPRDIFAINPVTGATSVAYSPGITANVTLNQLAVSRDGAQVFWTDGTLATSNVYEYTPATDLPPQTTPRGTATGGTAQPNASWNTMGGYDLATNRYIYGGAVYNQATASASLTVHSYDPATNTILPSAATVSLPGAAGGNGDLAFSPAGTMYVVTGGNSTGTNQGSDNAQLYRVTGGIPTTGTTTTTATALGGLIDNVRGLNSIAFGADGYLYLFGQTPTGTTTGTPQLLRVNPSNGEVVSRTSLTGPAAGGLTDLASCASPSTVRGEVVLDEPRQSPNDQFQVVIGGGDLSPTDPSTSQTTTGTGQAVTNNPVGPVIVLPGQTITVEQRPAAGNVTPGPDYAQEWVCRDTAYGNRIVSSGFGPQASFTMPQNPAIGSNIVCSFTTQEAVSSATFDKTWVDNGPITAIGQTITYSLTVTNTGNVPLQNIAITDPAPGLTITCPAGATTVNPLGQFNTVNTVTCTATRAATAADFQGTGTVDNTATVSYTTQQTPAGGAPTTASDTASFTPNRDAPPAQDDASNGNPVGQPVTVDVVGNDGTGDRTSVTIVGAPGDGKQLVVPGQGTWTVNPTSGAITFTPEAGFTGDPTPIDYSVAGPNGIRAEATVTVDYAPGAVADTSDANPLGEPVTVPVLDNDSGPIVPGTVAIVDPATGAALPAGQPLVVPGQGTWSIDPATGDITFTPAPGYTGNPTPITYQGADAQGTTTQATVTVRFQPEAQDDASTGNPAGQPVSLTPLTNDRGTTDPATFAFVDPATGEPLAPGAPLVVAGEGTWTFAPATGTVTFTPEPGFLTDPTPVDYQVSGPGSEPTQATITVEYAPLAVDDEDLGNAIGDVVTVDVLANDAGELDPTSVVIVDPVTGAVLGSADEAYVVDGEGEWTIDAETGEITFTPEDGFLGDPTPVVYEVTDVDGETTRATVTVGYVPAGTDDESLGNAPGTAVAVAGIVANDEGIFDPTTQAFSFLDPATGEPTGSATLVVAGEGTWAYDVVTDTTTFTPEAGFDGDPTPVDYQVSDVSGDEATATITVTYQPVARDDLVEGVTPGTVVTIPVLANDAGPLDPGTIAFIDPETGDALEPGDDLVVPGEGTWSVDPATGIVTFTPEEGYVGDPTPVDYTVSSPAPSSLPTTATITVDTTPDAVDDVDRGNALGETVERDVLANDLGDLDPATVVIVDATTGAVLGSSDSPYVVAGEGTWTIDAETGAIAFAPEAGFEGDPTPVTYRVADQSGDTATALVIVGYVPDAFDDESLGNELGTDVTVEILGNDDGALVPGSVQLIDPATGTPLAAGEPLVVDGEGTWTYDPATTSVTFAPAEGFLGDPTPIGYQVTATNGVTAEAIVTVDYDPTLTPDVDLDNVLGEAVTVDVLGNDLGELDPATVAIVDPATDEALAPGASLVVEGEGTWSIDQATGAITFTPEDGFLGDPTVIEYQVADQTGSTARTTVTVDYLQSAVADAALDQPITEPVTIDVLANDPGVFDPATLALVDPATGVALEPGADLVVAGEGTWTIDPETGEVTFTPEEGFLGNPTVVTYQVANAGGQVVSATITITFLAIANDDEDVDNEQGTAVTVDVLANDVGVFDPATVAIVDPATGDALAAGASLVVAGQGTWSVDPATGAITFTPQAGYEGDPTPIQYQATASTGTVATATVTVTYGITAVDDAATAPELGVAVTVPVLDNDLGAVDPATVAIVDPETGEALEPGASLVVDGEGTWSIDPATGAITFTPEEGFLGDPTPIAYEVSDGDGNVSEAIVTIDYPQVAVDDAALDQPIQQPVTIDVLANDRGVFDRATLAFIDPATGEALAPGADLVVAGEGTWSIDPETGEVTFTPDPAFLGEPTPVDYQVANATGQVVSATITITFVPLANDDADLANLAGETVTVDVLANDVGDFDPASVVIVDGEERVTELVVAGEGTWTVDPATGAITFTPEAGFDGDPTPIAYEVTDSTGDTVSATVTVTYGVTAVDDESRGNQPGATVTIDVVGNDRGPLDPTTVRIVDGDQLVTELVVPGEGTWTVDPETGAITFTPEDGFIGNPTPIAYQVSDRAGDASQAQVVVTYLPTAVPDVSTGNAPGTAVTVDPLANDSSSLDPTTVEIRDPATGEWGTSVTVPGQGTWTVDPVTGAITFTPAPGFTGDPTPIEYRAVDAEGNVAQSTVTISYDAAGPGQGEGPGAPAPGRPDLPRTGGDVATWLLLAGLGLLAAGGAAWIVRRRREDGQEA
ncbi:MULTISPECIES: Ig-like domain-containing protein [unclassified Agrococcus]|uniref:Ig-like domain-containing protein n=1 Tax=unclassified Agrococcus TaxID=2615065 RepID=UPI003618BD4E